MQYRYIIALLAAFALSASAQRGTVNAPPVNNSEAATVSSVKGHATIAQSHIKSLGTVGVTDRYEVVQVKIRGLDTPNLAGFIIYDRATDTISAAQTAGAPGLGVAIVNGSSYVAGNYLFGSKLKPDQTNVSNGSNSSATGGNSESNSSATGGAGGNASSESNSNATGGNGNGGAGGAGGSGGGPKIPPGHLNNPGHGPKK